MSIIAKMDGILKRCDEALVVLDQESKAAAAEDVRMRRQAFEARKLAFYADLKRKVDKEAEESKYDGQVYQMAQDIERYENTEY